MDVFQSDEFRSVRLEPSPAAPPARKTYPYTTGVLTAVVALAGGVAAWGLAGTAAFGWAVAAWLLLLVVLLARLVADLAIRRHG